MPAAPRSMWGVATVLIVAAATTRADYRIERIASGLDQPTYVTQAPGDPANILYFSERTRDAVAGFGATNVMGAIYRYDVTARTRTTVLDLSTRPVTNDDGLQTFAFHPDYDIVGSAGYHKMYVSSATQATNAINRVEEYTVGSSGSAAFSKTIVQYANSSTGQNHTVGWIGFDPTATGTARNYLYVSTGDGNAGKSYRPSQNPSDLQGKMLRIDVAGTDAYPADPTKNFAIPADNPLPAYNAAHPSAPLSGLGEVWLTGLRNASRAGFDAATGDLYLGDVGENTFEEIHFIKAGSNAAGPPIDLGWPAREGTGNGWTSPYGTVNATTGVASTNPIQQFGHTTGGNAVIGGYVYRGPVAELQGKYFYGDFVPGTVRALDFDRATAPAAFTGTNGSVTDMTTLWNGLVYDRTDPTYTQVTSGSLFGIDHIASFGTDNQGNLYIVDFGYGSGFAGQYPGPGLGEIFLVSPTVIAMTVASGVKTQAEAGFPTLAGSVPAEKLGAGTLVLDRANTYAGALAVKQGVVRVANAAALVGGTVSPLAGGTLAIAQGVQAALAGLDPRAGGLVDIGTGRVTVTAGLAVPDLVAALATGIGDGQWNGTSGITSSQAALDAAATVPRCVGWLDNGDGSVTFAYAAPGDTNLDGVIDIIDVGSFLAAGKLDSGSPATWAEGDYTYDGVVDVLDVGASLSTRLFDTGPYDSLAGSAVAVPEPAVSGAGLMLTAVVVLRCRRRRLGPVLRSLVAAGLGGMIAATGSGFLHAANQTPDLTPVVLGPDPIGVQILPARTFPGATLPSLHSFVEAIYDSPTDGHGLWVVMGGMTNGLHDLGDVGFEPAAHNRSIHVIDPVSSRVWSRSLDEASSGLTATQIESITTTNAQGTQIGSRFYVAGGYGFSASRGQYHTSDTLSAFDLGPIVDWVRTGTGSVAAGMRQIADPFFQVTGGGLATTPNGKTHLVFGQDYPDSYNSRQEGIYTNQVRTFEIVDDGTTLAVTGTVAHPASDDFRRRDLNVVPVIHDVGGQPTAALQALSGVFTTSFGVWTVPVAIDADGHAAQPDPAAATTFKQGMNGYRSAAISLRSAAAGTMHTILLGGISFQYFDAITGMVADDAQIPFIGSVTDVMTDADGLMSQHLLDAAFPEILSPTNGSPLLLGAEAVFFPSSGVARYPNGVIDLDSLTGPTLVGWVYGGLAADAPNHGTTFASNAVFPVVVTPVPEPASPLVGVMAALTVAAYAVRQVVPSRITRA